MEGPVLNLDELTQESVEFLLHGERRRIKPFDVLTSLKITNVLSHITKNESIKATLDSKELVKPYFDLFVSCVEPFTYEDFTKMSLSQWMSLYMLILRRECGEDLAKTYDQKKKTKPTQSFRRAFQQLKLSLMRLFYLDGSQKRA